MLPKIQEKKFISSSVNNKHIDLYEKRFKEILNEAVYKIEDFCLKNTISNLGIYITGSASISDIIVNEDGKFLSDIDLVLIFEEDDNSSHNTNLFNKLNSLIENDEIHVNLNFSSVLKRQNIKSAFTCRLKHLHLKDFNLEPIYPTFTEGKLNIALFILPPQKIGFSDKEFYSNIKFLKRSLELLIQKELSRNPNTNEILSLAKIKDKDRKRIQEFYKIQNKSKVEHKICLDIFQFNIYFLKEYLLDYFENKKNYAISNDSKLNFYYNDYIQRLLSKEQDLYELNDLNYICWNTYNHQKPIKTIKSQINKNEIEISINQKYQETESLNDILNQHNAITHFAITISEEPIQPIFLKIISISKKYEIPLRLKDPKNILNPAIKGLKFFTKVS